MIRHPRTWGRIGRLLSSAFMRSQLRDPEVRRKAWPDYTFGCKRILFSSEFLPALQRPNVELVTDRIVAPHAGWACAPPTASSARSTASSTRPAFAPPSSCSRWRSPAIGGRTLREAWADGPHAHLGIAVPGFPSLFVMYGPNTNTSGGSIIVYEEAQARYIRQALERVRDRRRRRDRGAPRGRGRQRPRAPVALRRDGLARLQLLVPRPRRQDRHQLARVHARVRGAGAGARPAEYELVPLPERESVPAVERA